MLHGLLNFSHLLFVASITICADGAANELYKVCEEHEKYVISVISFTDEILNRT